MVRCHGLLSASPAPCSSQQPPPQLLLHLEALSPPRSCSIILRLPSEHTFSTGSYSTLPKQRRAYLRGRPLKSAVFAFF